MAAPRQPASVVSTQTDFSAGEIDVALKRGSDHPMLKAGARQMANWRILNSRAAQNRSGRRALFTPATAFSPQIVRTEEVLMSPGNTFFLVFGNAGLAVFNASGAQVFSTAGMPWSSANLNQIVYAQYQLTIWITFQAALPQVLTWDGVSTWNIANFAEAVTAGNQKRTIFYRLSPKGVTMRPSAVTGNITMDFSSPICVAGIVGTRFRFCGRQIIATGFVNTSRLNGTVEEPLPPAQGLATASDPRSIFNVGDLVKGTISNAQGIVINLSATGVNVQLLSSNASAITQGTTSFLGQVSTNQVVTTPGFVATDILVSAGGSLALTSIATIPPQAVVIWDEEVMNGLRGWPGSVFFDQGRLGLANFPAVPGGIAWSAFGVFNDFFIDAPPVAAMFEITPDRTQVFYVVAGPESGEFVFCDRKLYYIPIGPTNPLKPGSVSFNTLDSDGAAQVQPRAVKEIIFYVASGGRRVGAVIAPGAYYRPFNTEDCSKYQDHLFSSIVALAAPSSDGTFPERYVYALNANGSLAVGKYAIKSGIFEMEAGRSPIGWLPWSGNGTVNWIAALSADVIFTSTYPGVVLAEILDDTRYLDASQLYNTQPAGLPIPGGKGPLWYLANGAVDLMDGPAHTRMMGTYQIDANGFLIAQNNAGEDFTSVNLLVGQAWTATLEPFVPPVQGGQDVGQRLWPRRILRAQVYVLNSTGFAMQRLYSDQSGPNLPAPGTVMKTRRITTWNQDEDPTQPPTLREQSYLDRPIGRSHDPRWALVKDTPGPIVVPEVSFEVTT